MNPFFGCTTLEFGKQLLTFTKYWRP